MRDPVLRGAAAAALVAVAGCNLIIGLQRGLPEGSGGSSSASLSSTGTAMSSTGTSSGGSPTSSSGSTTASGTSSSSGACTMDAGAPLVCDRTWAQWNARLPSAFTDNGDGTVTDATTQLLWQKGSGASTTQAGAIAQCQQLKLAGHCDWRLPTRIELGTLVDYTKSTPPLIDTTVFDCKMNAYWTASVVASSDGGVLGWSVNFNDGGVYSNTPALASIPVRCVR
jgi:hypothetical protein